MIQIVRIETVYPAPDDESDYCPEGESSSCDDTVSFRELVRMLRGYSFPSCSPASGSVNEWVSTEPYQDPYSGEWTETSVHYAHANPPKNAKYWRAAMRAAGFVNQIKLKGKQS